jgi:hypothetical protein
VLKLGDGPVALPADARTQERLEWIAEEVIGAAGEATLWKGRLTSAAVERALVQRMAAVILTYGSYRTIPARRAAGNGYRLRLPAGHTTRNGPALISPPQCASGIGQPMAWLNYRSIARQWVPGTLALR